MFLPKLKFFQKAIISHPTNPSLFLTMRRALDDESRPGSWDFPGGNVEFGEQNTQALKREVIEETGLVLKDCEIKFLDGFLDTQAQVYRLFAGFIATSTTDMITLSHEHSEYRWVTKDEFLTLDSATYLQSFLLSL